MDIMITLASSVMVDRLECRHIGVERYIAEQDTTDTSDI
jgi:hypothetical protein